MALAKWVQRSNEIAYFEQREFHDFILAQGLQPPAALEQVVMEEFVAPRLPAAP